MSHKSELPNYPLEAAPKKGSRSMRKNRVQTLQSNGGQRIYILAWRFFLRCKVVTRITWICELWKIHSTFHKDFLSKFEFLNIKVGPREYYLPWHMNAFSLFEGCTSEGEILSFLSLEVVTSLPWKVNFDKAGWAWVLTMDILYTREMPGWGLGLLYYGGIL